MSIKTLVEQLDQEINFLYEKYTNLHEELNQYRGKPIGDCVDKVNDLLKQIQQTFTELYPIYYFITHRNEYATNAINSYNEFVESLVKAGATQIKNDIQEQPPLESSKN